MTSPVAHWQIITTDPEGIAEFYRTVFGWKVSTANGLGYRELSTRDNQTADGGIWPAPPGSPEIVQLFIEVGDIDAKLREIENAGGKMLIARQQLPDGDSMALALDPRGRPFGLMTRAIKRD